VVGSVTLVSNTPSKKEVEAMIAGITIDHDALDDDSMVRKTGMSGIR